MHVGSVGGINAAGFDVENAQPSIWTSTKKDYFGSGKASRPKIHESDSRLPSHQAGRSPLAALQPDEDPQCGFSGTYRERKHGRPALAVAAPEREHAAQAHPRGGILFRAGRHRPPARGRRNIDRSKYGGVLVGPDQLRQVFNDTDAEVLWLIIGAPEELEFLQGSKSKMDLSLIYPTDPTQLPRELAGVEWPPKS